MRRVTGIAILAAALAACAEQPQQLSVDHAWIRLGAVKGNPAAAYFDLHGGPAPATLIAVSTDVAIKTEMHRAMPRGSGHGGMAGMQPIDRLAVPAGQTLSFQPGGYHVMMYDMNPGIIPGKRLVALTLTFADGTRLTRNATVVGAGDPPP